CLSIAVRTPDQLAKHRVIARHAWRAILRAATVRAGRFHGLRCRKGVTGLGGRTADSFRVKELAEALRRSVCHKGPLFRRRSCVGKAPLAAQPRYTPTRLPPRAECRR